MQLNELPDVVIDAMGGYKFIVVQVSDGNDSKIVIRANEHCDYHRDILALLRREASGLGARCIGGGRININPNDKEITISDSSGDFGLEPDRNKTVEMLQATFPEYKIISR